MAGTRLIWDLDAAYAATHGPDPAAVRAAGYDEQVVERQAAALGPWVEVSRAGSRPPLPASHTLYVYADPVAPAAYAHRVRFRRASDGAFHPTPLTDVARAPGGYCTIADVRAEGFAAGAFPDAQVQAGIDLASALIERVCGQWFDPRYQRLILDGRGHDWIWLNVPICTAIRVISDGGPVTDPGVELEIANRHLTRGQLDPDDRRDPHIAWAPDYYPYPYASAGAFTGRFYNSRRNVEVLGVFGCTELAPGEVAGEYSAQVPLSYGGTPAAIRRACLLLTCRRYMRLEASGDSLGAYMAGRVQSESTRDQSYSLGSPVGQDGAYGLTGDLEVDTLLMLYPPPLRMAVV